MAVLLRHLGLRTYINELEKTEGYQDVADNVVIDKPDVAEPRRGQGDYGDVLPTSDDRLKQVLAYKNIVIRHFNSTLQFDNGSGTFTDFSESITEPETDLRIKGAETKGNFYFTSDNGIKKISVPSSSGINTSSIEDAGAPKAVDVSATNSFGLGGFLPPQNKVAYRIVWGKRDGNNNLLLGTPSPRFVLSNTTSDVELAEQINVTALSFAATTDGTYFLLSSLSTDFFVWYDKTGTTAEPVANDTLGKTAVRVDISSATTADEVATLTGSIIASLTQFSTSVSTSIVTITSTEAGNDLTDAVDSALNATGFTISVVSQGETIFGSNANADIVFTVPSSVTNTDFFYQVYRTGIVEVPTGLTLADIDPGDDMNLVIDVNITSAELSAKEVSVTDITPDSLRAQGLLLYTNPNSGDGILQANDRPPIATDVELFRNHLFYSNTKSPHRKTVKLLSVSAFVSGTSGVAIGNSDGAREYVYIGETQVQQIDTVADIADSLDGDYFEVSSASGERDYYFWFSTGAGASDPALAGKAGVKVTINTGDSADAVATALGVTMDITGDFTTSVSTNEVTVTWAKNGNVASIVDGGSGFTFNAPSNAGDGEDAASNEVLLSSLASVAQAIDESARSLIRVINKDISSPVNAYYLSGPDDLPGIVLLEARSLEDKTFYVGSLDSTGNLYDPTIPEVFQISDISLANPTEITTGTAHGYSTGNEVFIYDTDSTPLVDGTFTSTVTGASTFTIPVNVSSAGTTGSVLLTTVASDNDAAKNRLYFSKESQPDSVPVVNFISIGPQDKAIERIVALRDNLFVLKEDGIYIVTGTSAPFTSRLIDSSVKIIAPDSAAVLNNQIFVLTSQGVAKIFGEGSAEIISTDIEDLILGVTNSRYDFKFNSWGISYESDRAYILSLPTKTTDTVATQNFRYNYFTGAWTRWTINSTCGLVNPADDKLYIGAGDRNVLTQERKNGDRTDHADRDFAVTLLPSSISADVLTLATVSSLEKGDAVVQVQYVTITQVNRLLRKLDTDSGLTDIDYSSTLKMVAGDNLKTKLDALNTKLVADDASGTVTVQAFSSDFETAQTEYNNMLAELNAPACDTNFKDYAGSTGTNPYESIIIEKPNTTSNSVTVN